MEQKRTVKQGVSRSFVVQKCVVNPGTKEGDVDRPVTGVCNLEPPQSRFHDIDSQLGDSSGPLMVRLAGLQLDRILREEYM